MTEEVRFRRTVLPGCDWLVQRSRPGSIPIGPVSGDGPLSPERRLEVASLLLERVARGSGRVDESATLARVRTHARALVESDVDSFEAWRIAATADLLRGALRDGLQAVATCESLRPDSAPYIRLDTSRLLLARGHLDEAAEYLDQLPAGVREDVRYVVASAAFDLAAGHVEAARERLEVARRRWPHSAEVAHELALARWALGALGEAVTAFVELRERRPRCSIAQWNCIAALLAAGRRREAEAAWADARPSVRSDPELRQSFQGPSERGSVSTLSGDLSAISLSDLVNLLGHSRANGALVITASGGRGELLFREGKLIGASSPRTVPGGGSGAPGRDAPSTEQLETRVLAALQELLEWESGAFAFEKRPVATQLETPSEVALETPVALLHACAGIDERKRSEAR